jgi:hypothetical protein
MSLVTALVNAKSYQPVQVSEQQALALLKSFEATFPALFEPEVLLALTVFWADKPVRILLSEPGTTGKYFTVGVPTVIKGFKSLASAVSYMSGLLVHQTPGITAARSRLRMFAVAHNIEHYVAWAV